MKHINKTDGTQYKTPEQREERRALGYAFGIHALLIVFMLVGFVSAPKTPNPVQVELWADGISPDASEPESGYNQALIQQEKFEQQNYYNSPLILLEELNHHQRRCPL